MGAESVDANEGGDAVTGSEDGELERIRQILIGDETRRQQARMEALEARFVERVSALERSIAELREGLRSLDDRTPDKARLSELLVDLARQLDDA